MKKEETNDIVQYLIPLLDKLGFSTQNRKVDVTTEKSGNKRGDIWISQADFTSKDFEKKITALIEAKHRKATIGDMDWRDAMAQGKEKSAKQGLNYYIVTNCRADFRFYNSVNDSEITVDGKVLTHMVPIDVLQKIQSQTNKDNSDVVHKTTLVARPISESKFRVTLRTLADIYRSAGLKKGDERIDPTVSFVVLKYISENERPRRTLDKVIKLWDDLRKIANEEEVGDLKVEFETMVHLIWYEDAYKSNMYRDFKDLIVFPPKLKKEHFNSIYKALDGYEFHGANFDLFGAIYEEFASQVKKREFGEFYTRRHITGIVARLLLRSEINPRELKVCDCACGTGGFLTEAYKTLRANYLNAGKFNEEAETRLKSSVFWGYDNDAKSVARTKLNMFLVGDGHMHIYENDDSLVDWNKDGWEEDAFDYVLTNPPMGSYEGEAKIENFKFTNERRDELLFVESAVKATKPGMEIAIVVNDGALEAPTRMNFRKKLLECCNIFAIVSLTSFAFAPYTREKTYILFMQKKQEGICEIQSLPIWHFIVDYDGFANSDKRYKTKYHDDLPELEDKFDGALKVAQMCSANPLAFKAGRNEFERDVNKRERTEALWGKKYGFVESERVNEGNFYNLLSEFHLRPIVFENVSVTEFGAACKEIWSRKSSQKYQWLMRTKIGKFHAAFSDKIGEIFQVIGGNIGLTEEFIYNNSPNNDRESVPILSSATIEATKMGAVSRDATPNAETLQVFHAPAIVVARNGTYAGKMTFIEEDEFTTNDHAYVMIPKPDWKHKVNLRWFCYQYQELFWNLVTSKSDNATFSKDYAEKVIVKLPKREEQNTLGKKLKRIDDLILEKSKSKP